VLPGIDAIAGRKNGMQSAEGTTLALEDAVHLHTLFLDGDSTRNAGLFAVPAFSQIPAPIAAQLQRLLERMSQLLIFIFR
jgi:hypothetical protein